MDFYWGGEELGARTHGGHVPPPRPAGLADGSTGAGADAQANPVQGASVGQDRQAG